MDYQLSQRLGSATCLEEPFGLPPLRKAKGLLQAAFLFSAPHTLNTSGRRRSKGKGTWEIPFAPNHLSSFRFSSPPLFQGFLRVGTSWHRPPYIVQIHTDTLKCLATSKANVSQLSIYFSLGIGQPRASLPVHLSRASLKGLCSCKLKHLYANESFSICYQPPQKFSIPSKLF